MLRRNLVVMSLVLAAVGGSASLASPAGAATFSGHSGTNYSGTVLVLSTTSKNTTVDIADNQLSSGKNAQDRRWCAVDVEVGFNKVRFLFGPRSTAATLGQYNKTTDFLWAGTAGTCS